MFVAYLISKLRSWEDNQTDGRRRAGGGENEDDDGIDPMLLAKFASATSHLPVVISSLARSCVLEFYGLYKQANEGPPTEADQPSWYDSVEERYKFAAWSKYAHFSKSEAMEAYCEKMAKVSTSWDPTRKTTFGWNMRPSRMETIEPEMFDYYVQKQLIIETESEKKWFEAARNDDVETMKKILHEDPLILEAKDKHLGMTALSRSVDLGCERVAAFLISKGADLNVRDQNNQTPLHFAALCHRYNLAEMLLAAGADPRKEDSDGNIPAMCCDEEGPLMDLLCR